MLIMPQGNDILRLLAIDPGTNTMGIALMEINLLTLQVNIVDAFTHKAEAHVKVDESYQDVLLTHGERHARLYAHKENLDSLLYAWQPHEVAAESPFMHIRPQAFAALVECMETIRRSVYSYDSTIYLNTVPPHSAKKAIGVVGKGMTKDHVKEAITGMLRAPERYFLHYTSNKPFDLVDEHALDAIAVGYFHYLEIAEYMRKK